MILIIIQNANRISTELITWYVRGRSILQRNVKPGRERENTSCRAGNDFKSG